MKILHVLTQLPAKTGSGVYFTNLIDSLNAIGTENAALYGTEDQHDFPVNASVIKEVVYNSEELPFHICGMSDEMPYDSTIYSTMTEEGLDQLTSAFEKRLLELKESFNPDLVISHHLFLITDVVRRVFKDVKVVGISHGTDIRQILKHPRFLERLTALKDLDQVLTVTPAEDDAIIKTLGIKQEKICLVGGGYNEKVFFPPTTKNTSDKIKLMYAGKITESKGIFALAAALPLLEKEYPQVELHIVGNASKEDRELLKHNAKDSKRLFIYDASNQREMADHLREADIFILPSYFEALGLIAIEALACHKLVVCSEIDGLKNLLGPELLKSGMIEFVSLPRIYNVDKPVKEDVPAYVERLVEAIKIQIKNLDEPIFTEDVKEAVKDFSWESIGKRIYRMIT